MTNACEVVFSTLEGVAVVCSGEAALHCAAVAPFLSDTSYESPIEIPLTQNGDLFPEEVIRHLVAYVEHFFGPRRVERGPSMIPKPKAEPVECYLDTWEQSFLRSLLTDGDARRHERLIALLNAAEKAGVETLRDMLLAWVATQIEILSEGKGAMEAAEALRQFFGIPNEWSEEDMEHLGREMAHY
eukprot:CAMPEP_0176471952 /NCGR_PEP_ID=MMETSP0127-20121128/41450_1 /TAXON_ID=938130 /ORGANISM="Platyophrya macrostoma, Strain WH" /LENGTH=185 /DNA_ID=CAMNT_0017866721 /DNA_START=23 /DNA_END=580 /DNA_ORIENTATION=-